jgi:hypothetical protein
MFFDQRETVKFSIVMTDTPCWNQWHQTTSETKTKSQGSRAWQSTSTERRAWCWWIDLSMYCVCVQFRIRQNFFQLVNRKLYVTAATCAREWDESLSMDMRRGLCSAPVRSPFRKLNRGATLRPCRINGHRGASFMLMRLDGKMVGAQPRERGGRSFGRRIAQLEGSTHKWRRKTPSEASPWSTVPCLAPWWGNLLICPWVVIDLEM